MWKSKLKHGQLLNTVSFLEASRYLFLSIYIFRPVSTILNLKMFRLKTWKFSSESWSSANARIRAQESNNQLNPVKWPSFYFVDILWEYQMFASYKELKCPLIVNTDVLNIWSNYIVMCTIDEVSFLISLASYLVLNLSLFV